MIREPDDPAGRAPTERDDRDGDQQERRERRPRAVERERQRGDADQTTDEVSRERAHDLERESLRRGREIRQGESFLARPGSNHGYGDSMTTNRLGRRELIVGALTASLLACRSKDGADDGDAIGPTIAPAALAARMDDVAAGKIAVLYVGPDALFERGHIPGARKIGEAGSAAGRRALADAIAAVPKETEIVVYCGCCPVKNCPNIRPASASIRASGRTNAHVLDLPTRFATDWADKAYPVQRG